MTVSRLERRTLSAKNQLRTLQWKTSCLITDGNSCGGWRTQLALFNDSQRLVLQDATKHRDVALWMKKEKSSVCLKVLKAQRLFLLVNTVRESYDSKLYIG